MKYLQQRCFCLCEGNRNLVKMNSDDEDVTSPSIPPEIIQQIIQALTDRTRNQQQRDNNRSGRTSHHVRQRHEIGIQLHQGLHPSGSSSDILPTRRGNPELILELELSNNRRFERVEKRLDRKEDEIDQLRVTIAGLKKQLEDETERRKDADAENVELREKVKKLEEHTIKCDADNAELREEVKKLNAVVSLHSQDIAMLVKEKEKRVFNS